MDQFPDIIIEIIFSYLMDRRLYSSYDKENFMVINHVRLVCRRFLNLEHYLVSNLVLGMEWTCKVYRLYQQDHPFWKNNLPYVHHLTFWAVDNEIDCSIFTHVKSLDIRGWLMKYRNYGNLYQLKQIFCEKDYNVSKLTKTNIHYHYRDWGDAHYQLIYDYGDSCQKYGCLIRNNGNPF